MRESLRDWTDKAAKWLKTCTVDDVIFTLGFLAVSIGFALAWPPLGLIVPGSLVCASMIWSRAKTAKQDEVDDA